MVFEEYELAVELLRERVLERIAAGLTQDRWEIGVAAELALALRRSVDSAKGLLSRARELHTTLPHTRERLRDGDISPEAVPVITHGLSHLDEDLRRRADATLCSDPTTLDGVGLRRLKDLVQKVAYELDQQGTVDRIAKAAKDRTVSIRPLPEGMTRVSLLLPLTQGVGVYAALRAAATAARGVAGEVRTLGQLMADTAFARLTGRDQHCRTPYCDAPIAHIDHVHRHASGGATRFDNGQGLCAACNYAKEGLGWHAREVTDPSGRHTVETTTPSGHVHRSTAPKHAA
ncbi:DUF222 domain-containing protein [Tsukamurella sp. PLM1]|uniref:HNH endonuclease n=1 Tax=Tsukamurella sp. PLM1 TaxID=2929795 RepID=UPI0035300C7B